MKAQIRYQVMSRTDAELFGAQQIASRLRANPAGHHLFSTGNTMTGIYAGVPEKLEGVDLSRIIASNVDEWGFSGQPLLPKYKPPTFYEFMLDKLHGRLQNFGLTEENIWFPTSFMEQDAILTPDTLIPAFDRHLRSGNGVEEYYAGIGQGSTDDEYAAHLAFMELLHMLALAEGWLDRGTYTGLLEDSTRENNVGYNGVPSKEKCPDTALTTGPKSLLDAVHGRIILFAFGLAKAKPLRGALEMEPSYKRPSSILPLIHERNNVDILVIMDSAAASELKEKSRFC
jgi:6-phosphogluconolactonase/glucosamine-6-phosphate isomerase/deaminase